MSFREKMSWLSLAGILVAFGPYFYMVAVIGGSPLTLLPGSATNVLAIVTTLAAIMAIASIVVALSNLRDAQAPSDERDRSIAHGATAYAYPVLLTGVFAALATLLLGYGITMVINTVLAAIVFAEITRCVAEIAGYRARG